jgi:Pentapeptide repeats (8 copies)
MSSPAPPNKPDPFVFTSRADLEAYVTAYRTYLVACQGECGNHSDTANLVDLRHADLRKVSPAYHLDLSVADLTSANLEDVHWTACDLHGGRLIETRMVKARLRRANLRDTSLEGALLGSADLTGADLTYARLGPMTGWTAMYFCPALALRFWLMFLRPSVWIELGLWWSLRRNQKEVLHKPTPAQLQKAHLTNAKLSDTSGLRLNDTHIAGARFSAHPTDPWSELKAHYSSSRLAFNMLFLVLFVLPLTLRAVAWITINDAQNALHESDDQLIGVVSQVCPPLHCDAVVSAIHAWFGQLKPCLATECDGYPVWQLLLSFDRGATLAVLACSLLAFQVGRAMLTYFVAALADVERQSGWSPTQDDYHWLWRIHGFVRVLFLIAIASLAMHSLDWLTPVVYIAR